MKRLTNSRAAEIIPSPFERKRVRSSRVFGKGIEFTIWEEAFQLTLRCATAILACNLHRIAGKYESVSLSKLTVSLLMGNGRNSSALPLKVMVSNFMLQALVENVSEIVVVIDANGVLRYSNPQLQ